LLKADAPPAGDDSPLGTTALEDGDGEDGRLSGGRETAAYPAAMNGTQVLIIVFGLPVDTSPTELNPTA